MNLKATILSIALLTVAASVSHAAGDCWIGPSGGVSIPLSDFKDASKLGFNGGAIVTVNVNEQFGVGLDAGFHRWKGSDLFNDGLSAVLTFLEGSPVVAEATWSAIQATVHGQYDIPMEGKVKPHLRAGVGIYNAKLKVKTDVLGSDETSKSKLGFNGGVGFNVMTSDKMAVGIDAAYHVIPMKDDLGIDLNAATVKASLLWKVK